jgi:hypothetical protein
MSLALLSSSKSLYCRNIYYTGDAYNFFAAKRNLLSCNIQLAANSDYKLEVNLLQEGLSSHKTFSCDH